MEGQDRSGHLTAVDATEELGPIFQGAVLVILVLFDLKAIIIEHADVEIIEHADADMAVKAVEHGTGDLTGGRRIFILIPRVFDFDGLEARDDLVFGVGRFASDTDIVGSRHEISF